ncbi:MAG TPA: serine/threonine-protein kinase [Terriglobales bacterium]|jgi:serine/threonine-protein kinase
MSNQLGRFEILSEINHSPVGSVYKANDPESSQTIAIKTLRLEALGEQAQAYIQRITEESAKAKVLNSHNLSVVNSVEEIEGQLCASLEYVQGNSVATMLARKEGFSIWDLQDIARQTCQGLDHAHAKGVFHASLEPAKIMVTWDGTVKTLGFGISLMGTYAAQAQGDAPESLYYMSPEQIRDDQLDARSNLFSLGAILYEMVTERKAFSGENADEVRQSILEMTPVAPDQINRKVHPGLSQLIMKAIAKSPDERYQSGQELVNDLERCKDNPAKAAAKAPPAPEKPKPIAQPPVQAKKSTPAAPRVPNTPAPTTKAPSAGPIRPSGSSVEQFSDQEVQFTPPRREKASAAAAGAASHATQGNAEMPRMPKIDPPQQFVSNSVQAPVDSLATEAAQLSAATAESEVESPSIHVDPMMAEASPVAGNRGRSFSEIDELPPLKEIFIAPPPPPEPPAEEPHATVHVPQPQQPEKPKVQPRVVARKAVKEIKKTPPKLFMYSIAGAVGVILLVIVGIAFHIRNEDADEDSTPAASAPTTSAPTSVPQPAPAAQAAPEPVVTDAAPVDAAPSVSIKSKYNPKKKNSGKTPAAAPAIVPGQITVNSTPEGAQIHIDGQADGSWITPFNVTGIAPGQHTITVSKAGFASENRTIDVGSGSKSVLVVQLAALTASVSLAGDPVGASIIIDGKDTGKTTPAQLSVEKPGNHTITLKKQGYLEESTTANLQMGQTFHYAPSLRPLGNADTVKTVGKFKKMFGGGSDTDGRGMVSVKTQPKGAQVLVNNRMLDKLSPVEFYLNPGNYVIDIVASGYKSVHRVVTVDKGGKVVIDDVMSRE